MKQKLKKAWSVGWRVSLCVVLLLWIFHTIFVSQAKAWSQREGLHWEQLPRQQQWQLAWSKGPQHLWHTLCTVHPGALAFSLLMVGAALWLGVVRWRVVLEAQGLDLALGRATTISLVAQFFNSFLLGSTGGDLIKAYYAARETHHRKTEAVTTVFVDRLVGLWAMLLFSGVMMLPNLQIILKHRELGAPALLILGMFVALSGVLSVAFWGGVSKRFPRARHYLRRLPQGAVLERSLDSCRQFGRQKMFLAKTVALSLIMNVVCVVQIAALGNGLDLGISFQALLVIVPIVLCISALPITPNGLGVRENLFVLLLGVIAVGQTPALSVSLLASAEGLFWSMIGGLVYMGLREREHLAEVTAETVTESN
jgi:glycosyltransferase 2 family protein